MVASTSDKANVFRFSLLAVTLWRLLLCHCALGRKRTIVLIEESSRTAGYASTILNSEQTTHKSNSNRISEGRRQVETFTEFQAHARSIWGVNVINLDMFKSICTYLVYVKQHVCKIEVLVRLKLMSTSPKAKPEPLGQTKKRSRLTLSKKVSIVHLKYPIPPLYVLLSPSYSWHCAFHFYSVKNLVAWTFLPFEYSSFHIRFPCFPWNFHFLLNNLFSCWH